MLVLIKYYVQPRLCSVFGKCLTFSQRFSQFTRKMNAVSQKHKKRQLLYIILSQSVRLRPNRSREMEKREQKICDEMLAKAQKLLLFVHLIRFES